MQQQNIICDFSNSDSWVILSPIEQSIKRKIEAIGTPLKDWDIQINYGIKTGFNDAFIISTEKRNDILSNCLTEDERKRTAELIRPILRGRDIKRYGYDWADLWLIYIPWHFPYQFDESIQGASEKAERIVPEQIETKKENANEVEESLSIGEDIGNVTYKLAKCCNPIPGDHVFGFVTNEGTISIHRVNCPNAKGLQQRYGYRIIKVKWTGIEGEGSQATISINGRDVLGLLGKITKVISEDLQVNMKNIVFNTDKDGYFQGRIVLQIASVDALELLMTRLKAIEGISDVVRID